MHTLKFSIVIPAHNEAENLRPTVEEIHSVLGQTEVPYEIILVNDCSNDATAEVIRDLKAANPNIHTVDRSPPPGFGRAIRSGLELVNGDVVAIYMADQSDDARDLLACYEKIEAGYDCVFGSRFIKGSNVTNYPTLKLIANRIVNRVIQWMFWCKFNDLTNAFKVYRTEVIRECGPYRASHFNITIEMSLSALIRRYNIAQIPIRWQGRTWGSSNLRISEMGRRYLNVLLKIFFERVLIEDDILEERISHRVEDKDRLSELNERVAALEREMHSLKEKEAPETEPVDSDV